MTCKNKGFYLYVSSCLTHASTEYYRTMGKLILFLLSKYLLLPPASNMAAIPLKMTRDSL